MNVSAKSANASSCASVVSIVRSSTRISRGALTGFPRSSTVKPATKIPKHAWSSAKNLSWFDLASRVAPAVCGTLDLCPH